MLLLCGASIQINPTDTFVVKYTNTIKQMIKIINPMFFTLYDIGLNNMDFCDVVIAI